MIVPLLLLLAATPAPPPVLEPDPGTAKRLQPRSVTASSFLQNGWNSYEQNYLPPYIADDDPTTAWVEGVKGRGEGESILWLGPTLEKAHGYTVFIRSGYQKSAKLYRANARPKAVRLEPVLSSESGPVAAGAPVEVTLEDKLGWQKITVPTQARVTGLRLTLVSTYVGTTYDDTCISDLRVYVNADDTYKPEAEAAAAEKIRQFAVERIRAAQRQGSQAQVVLAPRYTPHTLLHQELTPEQREQSLEELLTTLPVRRELKTLLASAASSANTFETLGHEGDELPPKEWSRVKLAVFHPTSGTAKVALAALQDVNLPRLIPLLHLKDTAFFEADATQSAMLARIEKMRDREAAEFDHCLEQCVAERARKKLSEDEGCPCTEQCSSQCADPAPVPPSKHERAMMTNGDFISGPVARPTAFLRTFSEDLGDRNPFIVFRQTLVTYEGERATSVASLTNNEEDMEFSNFVAYVLDWKQLPDGRSLLKSVLGVTVTGTKSISITRYDAA